MKFWMKKWLDFPNALMYGIGHGGVEAILIGGLSGISNLVSMLMINSGAMQNTLAALPAESANQTVSQLSALWTTPAPLFFCKRNRKNQCHHSAYRVVTADLPGGKGRQMQDSGFYSGSCIWDSFYWGLFWGGLGGPSFYHLKLKVVFFCDGSRNSCYGAEDGKDGRTVNSGFLLS